MTSPPSQTPKPPALWPPLRIETRRFVLVAELKGGDYIRHIGAPGDQTGFAADHGVMDFACVLVPSAGGFEQFAPKLGFELGDCFLLHGLPSHLDTVDKSVPADYRGFDGYFAISESANCHT